MRATYRKRNSIYLHMRQACSFDSGQKGCRFSENGRDRSGEGFLRAWLCMNTIKCAVQQSFCTKFQKYPPVGNSIKQWYEKFLHDRCQYVTKHLGWPSPSEERVVCVGEAFQTTKTACLPCGKILHKCLWVKPHRLKLLQALNHDDKAYHLQFCTNIKQHFKEDSFTENIIFSDEAMFHLHGKVNRHNVGTWDTENPCAAIQHVLDSLKLNIFCATSNKKQYRLFFFTNTTVTATSHLDTLQEWLMPQVVNDNDNFISQHIKAPLQYNNLIHSYLNQHLPQLWIGHTTAEEPAQPHWPPSLPDLMPCDVL